MSEAFTTDQPLSEAISRLIEDSSLFDKVEFRLLDRVGGGEVTEFRVLSVLPYWMWSAGERMLWEFCASLAGVGEVNLADAGSVLGHGEHAQDIVSAVAVLMGVVR